MGTWHMDKDTIGVVDPVCVCNGNRRCNALVNVNSQGPPTGIPRKFLVINAFLPLGVYRYFDVKMPLDGCSIPNTCAFMQIQKLEHVKDTQTNYFLSENPWVSGWGLTGSR